MSATRSRGSQTASGEPLPTVGLMTTEAAPVPLMGVKVEAELRDFAVHQTITQRYRNTEPDPIEAVYVFPIDEGAAVCGFNAVIDGRLIVGKVMEREAAFDQYDEALARGHGAYLLDQERPDVFTASVGNLPPGSEVMIQIMTVALLGSEGEDLLYILPTTVSPRYAPPQDRGGVGRPPAEALNPPVDWQVPYGLEVELHLHMPSAIQRVESPTHPLSFDLKGKQATIRLGEETTALDRDLVIRIGLESALQPRIHLERHPSGSHAAMLVFQPCIPPGEGAATGPEVVFLVDRSGSMDGPSIEGARTALQLFLRALPQGSRFNILGFGSTFHALFEGSRPYTPENLQAAFAYVERMGANMGGTEIFPALKAALEGHTPESDARQIIVLTDGQVTNTEEVIELAGGHSDHTRLFAIGLGAGASRHLVQGMARAGRGVAEFIAPGERIEPKVMRQVGRALAPAVFDLAVDWGGLEVEQAPYRVPPAFAGERLVLFGFLRDPREARVVLSGKRGGESFSEELSIDLEACTEGVVVSSLAARALIRDLEEGTSRLHGPRGSRQTERRAPAEPQVKSRLIELATTYGLLTSATSFVAIELRSTPVTAEMELRRIPVALTRGWGGGEGIPALMQPAHRSAPGFAAAYDSPSKARSGSLLKRIEQGQASQTQSPAGGGAVGTAAGGSARVAPPIERKRPPQAPGGARDTYYDLQARVQNKLLSELDPSMDISQTAEVRRTIEELFENILTEEKVVLSRPERRRLFEQIVAEILGTTFEPEAKEAARTSAGPGDLTLSPDTAPSMGADSPGTKILLLQQVGGAWNLSRELLTLIGVPKSPQEVARSLGIAWIDEVASQVIATWLALLWLERYAFAQRVTWRLAAAKARRWLDGKGPTARAGRTWEEIALEVLA